MESEAVRRYESFPMVYNGVARSHLERNLSAPTFMGVTYIAGLRINKLDRIVPYPSHKAEALWNQR